METSFENYAESANLIAKKDLNGQRVKVVFVPAKSTNTLDATTKIGW